VTPARTLTSRGRVSTSAGSSPRRPGRSGRASPDDHPSSRSPGRSRAATAPGPRLRLPGDADTVQIGVAGERVVRLTNLRKPFWPELGITKGDLLQYYADVAEVLLPHVRDRAMVMKRYPNGAGGPFFFMKRAPSPRPEWIELCSIAHSSGNIIDFPVIQDLPSLLWVVNLGCIDLNQWYARCDDVDRPDYLHFDLDPVKGKTVPFTRVLETALIIRDALASLDMPAFAKTTGSRGIHIYVPIVRGPTQKEVWSFAKRFALGLASMKPALVTAEYRVARRPEGRVLVDYNQNAWGRTLASVYSVRPHPRAAVSTPVTWKEVERGFAIEDFTVRNVPGRVRKRGDLWSPLLAENGRVRLDRYR
jgi:bifunctional non-homologous end joining protein LigD